MSRADSLRERIERLGGGTAQEAAALEVFRELKEALNAGAVRARRETGCHSLSRQRRRRFLRSILFWNMPGRVVCWLPGARRSSRSQTAAAA